MSSRIQRPRLEDDVIPTETFRLITTSQFLSIKELGRFLLFTSKAMTRSIHTEDEVWSLLLQSRFSFSPETISKLPMNAKDTFLALIHRGQQKRVPIAIRDLEYQPSDYKVMINIFEGQGGKAILSRIVDGENASSFFEDGSLTVKNLQLPYGNSEDLSVNVQILRLRNHNKALHLFQKQGPVDCDCGYIFFGWQRHLLELRDYDYGRKIFEAIGCEYQQVLGISVEVDTDCNCCSCCLGPNEIHTLKVIAKLDYPEDIEDFPRGREVTFAHFLEEFYGWE